MGPVSAQPVGPWLRDDTAYDPSVRIRHVEVDDRLFEVRNLLGPGWPMSVSTASGDHCGMAEWECWAEVETAARRHVETEPAR